MCRHVHCTYNVQDIKAHRQTDRHTGGQTDRYGETDGQAAGKQAIRQTDKQTERQTGRRTARQTDFEMFASTVYRTVQIRRDRWAGSRQ